MIVIYSNENNPSTLKLLISAQHAQKEVVLKLISTNDCVLPEPKHLPCLLTDENQHVFRPNVASRFLFAPSADVTSVVDEWLEWEATVLSPSIAHLLGSSIKSEKLKNVLISSLKKLDLCCQNKLLTGTEIRVCDVVIFSTLYALYLDKNLGQEYLSELSNLSTWIKHLESTDQVQKALKLYSITGGYQSYSSLLNGSHYVFPNTLLTDNSVQHSPLHGVETFTPEELAAVKKAWNKSLSDIPKPKQQDCVILPEPGKKNILVTSALPYVNNVPHLGNIIGCVLSADVFARFSRLCNYNVILICGTDEYGTATETKALEEKLTCREICDKYFTIHNEIYQWFNISFDHFGRTSTPQQTELCQEMFLRLNENGFMFTQPVDQLHCENCNRYLADRFVEGGCPHIGCTYEDARGDQCDGCGKLVNAVELKNPRCKICGQTPKLKTSHQFFIDLPKLEPLLLHWMKLSSPGWSNNAQVIGRTWLKEGLKPRCITRDLKWGVPVPLEGYTNKVFYVWFDAPLGYMSITKAYTKEWEKWWRPPPNIEVKLYQFMAKDNVPFHAVMFPATLLGANRSYTIVSHIMATEYLNYEDGKFSKSRGIGVFGNDARSTGIPSDVWRFYLLYVRPESQDSSFSWADLATKNNSELLNNLGNFINRALVFAKNNFNRTVPDMKPQEEDFQLLALCTREFRDYVSSLEKAKLRDGIRHILAISRHGNQYMQVMQPWVLLKGTDSDRERAGTVIGLCCNIAALLQTLLHPYMPDTSATLKKQLNLDDTIITPECPEIIKMLPAGHKLGEPAPLFAKIEPARVEELKKQFAGKQSENGINLAEPSDLKSLEAAVAKQAEKVRTLKASGNKSVWQPEVTVLLDLKKKLEQAKSSGDKTEVTKQNGQLPVQNGTSVDPVAAKQLEAEVEKQAAQVRKLKESGANKTVWQPEVEKLLQLKTQLAEASGKPLATQQKGKKSKK